MNCNKCGSPLSFDATICPVCGTNVFNQPMNMNQNMISNQNMSQPISNNNINQNVQTNMNNQPVSTNGLQIGVFNQNNVNNAPLINPNMMQNQNIATDDIFSSPKVSVNSVPNNLNNFGMMNNNMGMQNKNMNIQQPMNNMGNSVQPNFNNSNKKSNVNFKILIVGVVVLLLIVAGFFSYNYFQNVQEKRENLEKEEMRKEVEDNIDDYEEQRKEKAEQMRENVTLAEDNKLYDGSLLFTYENNNNMVVAVEFEIEFYDSENNFLGTAKEYAYPAPYSKFLIKISKFRVKEGYTNYKVNLTVSDYDLVPIDIDTNKFMISDNGEAILVQYNNTSEDPIDNLELCILYYDTNNIVGAECSSVKDIASGANANYEFEYYYANSYEGLKFDTYKFAVSAYNKSRKNDL